MHENLSRVLFDLRRAVAPRAASHQMAHRRNYVAWLVSREGWYSVRQCSVTYYSPECVRFRNDIAIDIPKRVWPFSKGLLEWVGKMEITIHESEVPTLSPLIVEVAENALHDYESPFFPDGRITPSYCWSIKADAHYNQEPRTRKAKLPKNKLHAL